MRAAARRQVDALVAALASITGAGRPALDAPLPRSTSSPAASPARDAPSRHCGQLSPRSGTWRATPGIAP